MGGGGQNILPCENLPSFLLNKENPTLQEIRKVRREAVAREAKLISEALRERREITGLRARSRERAWGSVTEVLMAEGNLGMREGLGECYSTPLMLKALIFFERYSLREAPGRD